jgi:tRNA A-37 threonylcarbamoyl transferase component Bud32
MELRGFVLGPFIATTKSFVIRRVTCSAGTLLVAKYPRNLTDSSRQALQRQFKALTELSSAVGPTLQNSVPRPIEHNDGMLLMSFVPGVALKDILRLQANAATGWKNKESLQAIGRNVGTWLRKFQAATNARNVDVAFNTYLAELEANARRCRASGLPDKSLSKVLDHARSLIADQQKGYTHISASHGDFLPQNILIDGSNVGVVDFDNYSAAAPHYRDLAALLAYISLLAAKKEYSRSALTSFSQGLMSGYGHDVDVQLLKLFLFNAALRVTIDGTSSFTKRQCSILESVLSDTLCNRIIGFPSLDSSAA